MTDDCNCNAVRVVFLKTSFDFLFFFVYRNTVRYGGMVVWLMVQPYAYDTVPGTDRTPYTLERS